LFIYSCVLSAWYGSLRPGGLLTPTHLDCPFCKRAPTAKVLRMHNERGCELVRARGTVFDPTWLYGWCTQCYKPAQYMERACAQLEMPELKNFICIPCQDRRRVVAPPADLGATTPIAQAEVRTRQCPGCQVMTEKMGGCDHITCEPCGAHWCWRCGGHFTEDSIYEHIYECTG
jgi:hypothetical protein